MGYSFFLLNHTKKQIFCIEPYDILRDIQNYIANYEWTLQDDVDLLREDETDVRSLVEQKGYSIDYKFWRDT